MLLCRELSPEQAAMAAAMAEAAKVALSTADRAAVSVPAGSVGGGAVEVVLTRATLEAEVAPLLRRLWEPMRRAGAAVHVEWAARCAVLTRARLRAPHGGRGPTFRLQSPDLGMQNVRPAAGCTPLITGGTASTDSSTTIWQACRRSPSGARLGDTAGGPSALLFRRTASLRCGLRVVGSGRPPFGAQAVRGGDTCRSWRLRRRRRGPFCAAAAPHY